MYWHWSNTRFSNKILIMNLIFIYKFASVQYMTLSVVTKIPPKPFCRQEEQQKMDPSSREDVHCIFCSHIWNVKVMRSLMQIKNWGSHPVVLRPLHVVLVATRQSQMRPRRRRPTLIPATWLRADMQEKSWNTLQPLLVSVANDRGSSRAWYPNLVGGETTV